MTNILFQSNSSKEDREAYKNKAVETREAGNLKESLKMFEDIFKWDEKNGNTRGAIDIIGHIRITLTRMSIEATDRDIKENFLKRASDACEKALMIINSNNGLPDGVLAIHQVHYASSILSLTKINDKNKEENLTKALSIISLAIEKLPGSKAHKAWPLNIKAKILYALGRGDEAVKTLAEAEVLLFEGYDEEVSGGDQAEIKLNAWLSGIHLTFASICKKEGKIILARHYASSVLTIEDPKNTLGERKKEARRILDSLKHL